MVIDNGERSCRRWKQHRVQVKERKLSLHSKHSEKRLICIPRTLARPTRLGLAESLVFQSERSNDSERLLHARATIGDRDGLGDSRCEERDVTVSQGIVSGETRGCFYELPHGISKIRVHPPAIDVTASHKMRCKV